MFGCTIWSFNLLNKKRNASNFLYLELYPTASHILYYFKYSYKITHRNTCKSNTTAKWALLIQHTHSYNTRLLSWSDQPAASEPTEQLTVTVSDTDSRGNKTKQRCGVSCALTLAVALLPTVEAQFLLLCRVCNNINYVLFILLLVSDCY